MAYAIVRIEKKKMADNAHLHGVLNHNFRIGEQSENIDKTRTAKNEYFYSPNPQDLRTFLKNRWAKLEENNKDKNGRLSKFRDNTVGYLEVVITASPDFFQTATKEQLQAWKSEQLKFAEEEYGKENVASGILHLDEKTPHFHFLVVPVVNGKLNAKAKVGSRKDLSAFQSRYAARMEKFGLERGKCRVEEKVTETPKHQSPKEIREAQAMEVQELKTELRHAQEITDEQATKLSRFEKFFKHFPGIYDTWKKWRKGGEVKPELLDKVKDLKPEEPKPVLQPEPLPEPEPELTNEPQKRKFFGMKW